MIDTGNLHSRIYRRLVKENGWEHHPLKQMENLDSLIWKSFIISHKIIKWIDSHKVLAKYLFEGGEMSKRTKKQFQYVLRGKFMKVVGKTRLCDGKRIKAGSHYDSCVELCNKKKCPQMFIKGGEKYDKNM